MDIDKILRIPRPLLWIGSSKKDLLAMPQKVRSEFGHGLHQAQMGAFPSIGKPLNGFGGTSVIELDIDLIRSRLMMAEEMFNEWKKARMK